MGAGQVNERMHLLYVDESGDTGRHNPENHTFVLCGLMVHHADWHEARLAFLVMRIRMEQTFGLPRSAEIHASELLGRGPSHFGLDRTTRIKVALHQVEMIRRQRTLFSIRIVIDKRNIEGDVLALAWHRMLSAAKSVALSTEHGRCSSPGIIIICDDHRTKATFFVLGWIADKHPALVKRIAEAGHELGTHSFWHRKVYELTPESFSKDGSGDRRFE